MKKEGCGNQVVYILSLLNCGKLIKIVSFIFINSWMNEWTKNLFTYICVCLVEENPQGKSSQRKMSGSEGEKRQSDCDFL